MQLWVVAEALDAVFDVFAEDHLNPLMREIGLIEKLQALVPYLKHKVGHHVVYYSYCCCGLLMIKTGCVLNLQFVIYDHFKCLNQVGISITLN